MEAKQENPTATPKVLSEEEDDGKSDAGTEICSEFRSCSCYPTKLRGQSCCAAKLVEKLMAQLKALEKREKELTERSEKAESELEMVKKNKEILSERAKLHKKQYLENAHQLHTTLCKTFPLPSRCYTIAIAQGNSKVYLYACASDGDMKLASRPYPCTSNFEIHKNSDGSFSIFSPYLKKYFFVNLIGRASPKCPNEFGFKFANNDSIGCKFEFVFAEQSYLGLLTASIRCLSDDTFLHFYNCDMYHQQLNTSQQPETEFLFAIAE